MAQFAHDAQARRCIPGDTRNRYVYARASGRTDGRTARVGKVWCNASKNVIIYFYRNRYAGYFIRAARRSIFLFALSLPPFFSSSSYQANKSLRLRSSANVLYVCTRTICCTRATRNNALYIERTNDSRVIVKRQLFSFV